MSNEQKNLKLEIIGEIVQKHIEENPNSDFAKTMERLRDENITNPEDRKLMGLDPVE